MKQYWFKTSHGVITENWKDGEIVAYGAAGWKWGGGSVTNIA